MSLGVLSSPHLGWILGIVVTCLSKVLYYISSKVSPSFSRQQIPPLQALPARHGEQQQLAGHLRQLQQDVLRARPALQLVQGCADCPD